MKGGNHRYHHLAFLDSEGMEAIHQAVLKVLSEVGNKVMEPHAMDEMHTALNIRPAVSTDAQSLADLVQEAGLFEKIKKLPLPNLVSEVENAIEICAENKSHDILVVTDSKEIIFAYAVIQWHITLFLPGNEGYISELTVRADSRGQGIGSMLLDRLIEEGKKRNCTRMSLINSRFRGSYKSGFYNKRGWYERDVAANFIYNLN